MFARASASSPAYRRKKQTLSPGFRQASLASQRSRTTLASTCVQKKKNRIAQEGAGRQIDTEDTGEPKQQTSIQAKRQKQTVRERGREIDRQIDRQTDKAQEETRTLDSRTFIYITIVI